MSGTITEQLENQQELVDSNKTLTVEDALSHHLKTQSITHLSYTGMLSEKREGDAGHDIYLNDMNNTLIDVMKSFGYAVKNLTYHVEIGIITNRIKTADFYHDKKLVMRYKKSKYYIYHPVILATEIRVDIPKGLYVTIDNRSSNIKNNISIIRGIVDTEYVNFVGIQVMPLQKTLMQLVFGKYVKAPLILNRSQRIAQLVLHHHAPVELKDVNNYNSEMEMSTFFDFETLPTVLNKKKIRNAGFGSSGK